SRFCCIRFLDSILQIRHSGFHEFLNDGKHQGGGNSEQEHAVCGFERAQQCPTRTHDDVAIPQRRVVDRRVVIGSAKILKLSAKEKQNGPKPDLSKVSDCCIEDRTGHDADIDPETRACPAAAFFAANEVDSSTQGKCMNHSCAHEID